MRRRGRFPRRARGALLWGLATALALQLGLALLMERWLPEFRDPHFFYKAQRLHERFRTAPAGSFTVVMLGSSRTAFGLRGQETEERLARELGRPVVIYNFGVVGAGPVTQLLYLKRLLAEGLRPDLLLVEVLPPLLAGQTGVPAEAHWLPATRLWLPELTWLRHFHFPVAAMRRIWWEAWPVPWYARRFTILSRFAPAVLPYQLREDWSRGTDAWGWAPGFQLTATPAQHRTAVERARLEYTGYFVGLRLDGPACAALEELLGVCRREGMATAMVLMPEGPEFRSWYPPAAWVQIQAYLREVSRTAGAPIIDAREWVPEEDFSDSHHLQPHGASVFSERLGREPLPALVPQIEARRGSQQAERR